MSICIFSNKQKNIIQKAADALSLVLIEMINRRKTKTILPIFLIFFASVSITLLFSISYLIYFLEIWRTPYVSPLSLENDENSTRISWDDEEAIRNERMQDGFGQQGEAAFLNDPLEIKQNEILFKEFGMSLVISDKISVNRSIPDFRHPGCLKKKYLSNLPKVSVIILFNNEAFSVFKRSLHSLYNRTPHSLIEEVILVNDKSTYEYLYDPLKKYVKENFPSLTFHFVDLKERIGLSRARIEGARAAKGKYIFVSESHVEYPFGWLPPLLEPHLAHASRKRLVTTPIIDNIEYFQLKYYENDLGNLGSRGIFDWDLEYNKLKRFNIADEKMLEPFQIPIMTGGIYLLSRDYFFEIGPYDEKLIIWGAENIEMSLKIHLCGGELLEVPCSHVGHLFRQFTKSRVHDKGLDFLRFNRKRIVEVWFDEYKKYVYERDEKLKDMDVGDMTKALLLKKRLNCQPFSYFLDNIAPDLISKYSLEKPKNFASGQLRMLNSNLCLNGHYEVGKKLTLSKCIYPQSTTQNWIFNYNHAIQLSGTNLCFDFFDASILPCTDQGGHQFFHYDFLTQQIVADKPNLCLEGNRADFKLHFSPCLVDIENQKWIMLDFRNDKMIKNWKTNGRKFDKNFILD